MSWTLPTERTVSLAQRAFNPSEPRDPEGRWTGGKLYHGSMHEFKPGDVIRPGHELGIDNEGIKDNKDVSLTTYPDEARGHGIHVYEVLPHKVLRVFDSYHGQEARVTGATVVRELDPSEIGKDYMPTGPVAAYERLHKIGTYATS